MQFQKTLDITYFLLNRKRPMLGRFCYFPYTIAKSAQELLSGRIYKYE
jgi:hypothetical protein